MKTIFIDGSYGTVGLILSDLVDEHPLLTQIKVPYSERKNITERMELIEQSDIVVTCLPNKAIDDVVNSIPITTKLIDCSTRYRCDESWIYGLPELKSNQRELIGESSRTVNAGCFASAFILAIKPLVKNKVISKEMVVSSFSLTGYSAGGVKMIQQYEKGDYIQKLHSLNFNHKHLPEMKKYSGLLNAPHFIPAIGHHREGLILTIPLNVNCGRDELLDVFFREYGAEENICIKDNCPDSLEPNFQANNNLEIYVGGRCGSLSITTRLNNLYKGAAGNALQCINLMLGFDENIGLK